MQNTETPPKAPEQPKQWPLAKVGDNPDPIDGPVRFRFRKYHKYHKHKRRPR